MGVGEGGCHFVVLKTKGVQNLQDSGGTFGLRGIKFSRGVLGFERRRGPPAADHFLSYFNSQFSKKFTFIFRE